MGLIPDVIQHIMKIVVAGWCSGYSGQHHHPNFSKDMGSNPVWGAVTSVTPNCDGILGAARWLAGGGSPQNNVLHIVAWQADK